MYKLEFFVREIDENTYATDYKFYQNDNVLDARTYMYHARIPVKHFNDAVARIKGIIALSMSRIYGVANKEIHKVCLNPESDFLTRSEMAKKYWANRWEEEYAEAAEPETTAEVLYSEPQEAQKIISNVRQYEVVELDGVWAIKKHDNKWYTAEEAKTQLFAHVVNGD